MKFIQPATDRVTGKFPGQPNSHFLPGLPIIHDKNLSLPLSEDEDGGEQELITNDGRSKFTYLTWVLLHYFKTPEVQLEIVL